MTRWTWCLLAAGCGMPGVLTAQGDRPAPARPSVVAHYGKWLTAGAAAAFTALAAHEHRVSRSHWTALLAICRSADDACVLGPGGGYVNPQAEDLYQAATRRDRRANARLLGAQAGVLLTAALFLLDRRGRSDEPDNIPLAPVKVTVEPTWDGAAVGVRLTF